MEKQQVAIELLKRPIAYHPAIAKAFGSVNLALMWSQLYYWSERTTDPDGWIYKSHDEMFEETGLSRREQDTARKLGVSLGVLDDKLAGSPPRIHYKINVDETMDLLDRYIKKTKKVASVALVPQNSPGKIAQAFFSGLSAKTDLTQEILQMVDDRYGDAIRVEIEKFIEYWTEPNKTGTKQRWEMQPTFEVKRRLFNWLRRSREFSLAAQRKGITIT